MQQCVQDANSEARQFGRKSFLIWQKLAPENAQNLFALLDYQAQKAIIEEQDRLSGVDSEDKFSIPTKKSGYGASGQGTNHTSNLGSSVGSHQTHDQQKKMIRPSSNNNRRSAKQQRSKESRGSRGPANTSQNRQSIGVYSQNSQNSGNFQQN